LQDRAQSQRGAADGELDHVGRGSAVHRRSQRPVSRQHAGQGEAGGAGAGRDQDLQGGSGRGRTAGRPDQGAVRQVLQGMTVRRVDLSGPALAAVAMLLAIMIVLPMGWLMIYAFADKDGQATVANFVTLFT